MMGHCAFLANDGVAYGFNLSGTLTFVSIIYHSVGSPFL